MQCAPTILSDVEAVYMPSEAGWQSARPEGRMQCAPTILSDVGAAYMPSETGWQSAHEGGRRMASTYNKTACGLPTEACIFAQTRNCPSFITIPNPPTKILCSSFVLTARV